MISFYLKLEYEKQWMIKIKKKFEATLVIKFSYPHPNNLKKQKIIKMNLSMSSYSSHVVNSVDTSIACKFKTDKDQEPLKSFRSLEPHQIEVQPSARSNISNLSKSKLALKTDSNRSESSNHIQIIYTNRSSTPEPKRKPKLKPKKKRIRRRLTLPPPRIMETNETSKASEIKFDNYQLLKNTKKFFECFEYKKTCLNILLCRPISVLQKLKQLKYRIIEQKYCKRSFKRVMGMKNDLKMSYDRHVNVVDLNILCILIKDGTAEFDHFLNVFGVRVLYLQIFGVSEKVLESWKEVVLNSKIVVNAHPAEFLIRVVAGYFLKHFQLIHGKYNFYETRFVSKLLSCPDEFFGDYEIN